MDRTKKILITMLVLGALAAVGGGTYASFNAVTTNPGNTFQTGSIFLSNDKNTTATTCFSYGTLTAGQFTNNNTQACSTLVTVATTKPSATVTSVVLHLKNVGTSNGTLGLATTCASVNSDPTASGNRNLCDRLAIRITPCAAMPGGYTSGNTTCNSTSVTHCVYSQTAAYVNTAAACGALGYPVLGAMPAAATAGSLTDLATRTAANTTVDTINAGNEVYYQVDIQLPDTGAGLENDVQGKTATFGFTWTLS
jgi:predicted ribosomally synthesized peptide with SipW-like signal peptide